jgi:hypothetical protein
MRSTFLLPSLLLAACASAPADAPKGAPAAPAPVAAAPATTPTTTKAVSAATVAEPKATSAADLVDHLGDSVETAVPVPKDARNDGLDWMNNWTFDRFGRFRIHDRGIGHAGEGPAERRYRITTVELPDGSLHKIFFDITENWNAWQPPGPPATPPHL